MKKKVLVFADYFLPGFKAGGPIRTLENMVDNLRSDFDFFFITRDRDEGDFEPYSDVKINEWQKFDNFHVYYLSPQNVNIVGLKNAIMEAEYDLVYLNSYFSKLSIFYLTIKKFDKSFNKPVLLAPRGEFSPGAVNLKRNKKTLFIKASKIMRLYKNVTFHASNELEESHIRNYWDNEILVAPNLSTNKIEEIEEFPNKYKVKNEVKFVFISRISKKKNLKKAVELLMPQNGKIIFDIYGPNEDRDYLEECLKIAKDCNVNLKVTYKGALPNKEVLKTFNQYHFFIFPTFGENYGHAIVESFRGGCPVVLSTETPWRKLISKNVGWDIPLLNEKEWREILEKCIEMEQVEYDAMSKCAYEFGKDIILDKRTVGLNREMFKQLTS